MCEILREKSERLLIENGKKTLVDTFLPHTVDL